MICRPIIITILTNFFLWWRGYDTSCLLYTSRLWHMVMLYRWRNVFEYIPLESQIERFQAEYYDAIAQCHVNGNSDVFIEFMLSMIDPVSYTHLDVYKRQAYPLWIVLKCPKRNQNTTITGHPSLRYWKAAYDIGKTAAAPYRAAVVFAVPTFNRLPK